MLLTTTNPAFYKISITPLPLRRPMRRWGDNIKIDRQEIGLNVWIEYYWFRIGTVEEPIAR
jgi:hypothetical protein